MNIKLNGVSKEETAYDKRITFTYEGESYSVLLHWDMYDGYDLNFLDGRNFTDTPDWAVLWEDSDSGEDLDVTLDNLSDEVLNGVYEGGE